MLWLILALCSAVSAGFVSITVKIGMKNVSADISMLLRTAVVLIFALIITLIVGGFFTIASVTPTEWIYIALSGVATGLSWLCYYKALKLGNINKVVPVDKLSTVLTMTLAIIIFNEHFWWLTFVAMALMVFGAILMVIKKREAVSSTESAENAESAESKNTESAKISETKKKSWLFFAVLSVVFASFTAIFAKLGMRNINAQAGTFFRTAVVLIMAFIIVSVKKDGFKEIKAFSKSNWVFIVVSGLLTGVSWLCFFASLQLGSASVVVPIDKLSVAVSVLFSVIIFKEKLSLQVIFGLLILVAGTLLLLL
ncbi:MAG: EamA family transporter [Firmicutes bacterium]|nr:EamA family transporter [Bacillota bacterium]